MPELSQAIPVFRRWRSGRWYSWKSSHAGSNGTSAMGANTLYAQLLRVPEMRAISAIGANITAAAAAGKLLRLGIYTQGADGNPGALLVDSGPLAADAIAAVSTAVSAVLPAGDVWTVCVSDGAPTLTAYIVTQSEADLGWAALTTTTPDAVLTRAFTFGALPAAFGAVTGAGTVPFRVAVQAS